MKRLLSSLRVEYAVDKRASGEGVTVTLRQGFTFEFEKDERTRTFRTVCEAAASLKYAYRYPGRYDA